MHSKNIQPAGKSLQDADKVLLMLHGRGANARDILALASHLNVDDFALLAPQAANNTWYPYSFMAKPEQNEPWLTAALDLLQDLINDVTGHGIAEENIYFLGFSQGACLTLEYVTRHAIRYGGVVGFTGGLIGDKIAEENYSGNFKGTPIFLGTGNPDPHVPLERVKRTQEILEKMGAQVDLEIYDNRPHTISPKEIELANKLIFK